MSFSISPFFAYEVFCRRILNMGNYCAYFCPPNSLGTYRHSRFRNSFHESDSEAYCSNDYITADEYTVPKSTKVKDEDRSQQNKLLSSMQGPKIAAEYVNFHFLNNDEIANWIVHNRFMFILRGPPGSGKSFISECIRTRFPATVICSADNFWYLASDGFEYQFDVNRLNEAHEWCQNRAYEAASQGQTPIVIDNTNIRHWETRNYTEIARQFNYFVIMLCPQTPWRFDAETLAMRNIHFVSIETIESKVRNFELIYPLYYAWFWPANPSNQTEKDDKKLPIINKPSLEVEHLLTWAWDILNTIINLTQIHDELVSTFNLSSDATIKDILSHWESATTPKFGCGLKCSTASSIPHITAKYSQFGRAFNAKEYALRGAVCESLLGYLFTVQVTGLVISSRTIGVRIRLPTDELVVRHLWDSDDQVSVYPDESRCERPIGCRAHVTLALAPGISAVETGLDLLRVVDRELNNQPGEHVAVIKDGSVRRVKIRKLFNSPYHDNSRSHNNSHHGFDNFENAQSSCLQPEWEYIYVYDLDFPHHYRVLFAASY